MHDLSILYAEDDLQSRKNYTFVLKEYFSQIYLAEDGREALDLYQKKKPDILLLDISMPFVDGLEVAKTVREENEDIPIIMLTAHSDKEKLLKAIPLGLSGYLLKPTKSKEFSDTIVKVIRELETRDMISLHKTLKWNKIDASLLYHESYVNLTKKEKRLMGLLTQDIGEYFMHDTLIIQIWDKEIPDASHDNKLHQLIYRLNKKINTITNCDAPLVENSYTLGYRVNYYT